jgi:hypothetical protein
MLGALLYPPTNSGRKGCSCSRQAKVFASLLLLRDKIQPGFVDFYTGGGIKRHITSQLPNSLAEREALGYEPVDGGDQHFVSAGQIPVNTPQITGTGADGNLTDGASGGNKKPLAKTPKPGAKYMSPHAVHYLS